MKPVVLSTELLIELRDDSKIGLERQLAWEVLRLRKLLAQRKRLDREEK